MTKIATYVFFDLETTGLIEGNDIPAITELGMIAVKRTHFLRTSVDEELRVQSKFRMCFDPLKPMSQKSIQLSGLTNELLEEEPEFSAEAFEAISSFINCLQKPVCLIAHNGFTYHFPILKYNLNKIVKQLSSDVMCTDSLYAFYDLLEEEIRGDVDEESFEECFKVKAFEELLRERFYLPGPIPEYSYQLIDIYGREVAKPGLKGNRSENQCTMILKIAQERAERFSAWVAGNHCYLSHVHECGSLKYH